MSETNFEISPAVIEILASIEHERWAKWQSYLHSQCTMNDDGSLTIPSALVTRWKEQISTPYEALSAGEKESDRELIEAERARYHRVLEVIKGSVCHPTQENFKKHI